MLTLDKIYHAAFVLKDVARKTDLIEAQAIGFIILTASRRALDSPAVN